MSIELTTKEIGTEKVYFDAYVDQAIDSDISLPDYCPDIMRILKCTVHTNITSSKLTGDRASADGNAEITVIYSDEKNNICAYKSDFPFSKVAELSAAYDRAVLVCTAKTDYVNCRAVSKRRLDIRGVVSLRFRVSGIDGETVVSSAQGDGIQLKCKALEASCTVASAGKCFQVSSVEQVGDSMPGIGKVLDCFTAPLVNETKIIKGKLLVKGELALRVTYASDDGSNDAAVFGCTLPFNEIIEATDFNESCKTDIKLNVTRISAEPKVDNDGEYRYMNINAELCAYVTAYEPTAINTVTDTYSTERDVDAGYSLIDFKKIVLNVSDTLAVRQNIDIASLKPQKIYACILSEPEGRCSFADGRMTVSGKLPLGLIIIDEDGTPVSCEREAEFEYTKAIDAEGENPTAEPDINVSGCSCTLNGDGTADFKAEINIGAVVFGNLREKVLTSLAVSDGTSEKAKKPSLTVYFCSGGESLWDIARHYNTTVEAIMEENGAVAEHIDGKTMLMIPVK